MQKTLNTKTTSIYHETFFEYEVSAIRYGTVLCIQ